MDEDARLIAIAQLERGLGAKIDGQPAFRFSHGEAHEDRAARGLRLDRTTFPAVGTEDGVCRADFEQPPVVVRGEHAQAELRFVVVQPGALEGERVLGVRDRFAQTLIFKRLELREVAAAAFRHLSPEFRRMIGKIEKRG